MPPLRPGKLLAAAAHERRVVREARRAASLSAWYEGDLKSLRARVDERYEVGDGLP